MASVKEVEAGAFEFTIANNSSYNRRVVMNLIDLGSGFGDVAFEAAVAGGSQAASERRTLAYTTSDDPLTIKTDPLVAEALVDVFADGKDVVVSGTAAGDGLRFEWTEVEG